MVSIDITISTYNRVHLLKSALDSSLEMVRSWGNGSKVILIDDASIDDTVSFVNRNYNNELQNNSLIFFQHQKNRGVTAAKNTGYQNADSDWVIFLDSDDSLFLSKVNQIQEYLTTHNDVPMVFFRCLDQDNNAVGTQFSDTQSLNLSIYLKHGSYGEGLVAINKNITKELPYEESLRGYEGLGYTRIIKKYGSALLAPIYARRYNCMGSDRLSTANARIHRARYLSKGHYAYLQEFYNDMNLYMRLTFIIKILGYAVLSLLKNVVPQKGHS